MIAVKTLLEEAFMLGIIDILIIIFVVVAILGVGFYFLNKWASNKVSDQQKMIDATSQTVNIYVIDKKKEKAAKANLPRTVLEQMPKRSTIMKIPFVKAKVGPQILTLMCDKNVYDALPIKKNVTVDISGIYITNMKGMKTKEEMKALKKEKAKNKK